MSARDGIGGAESGLFSGLFARGAVARATSDRALLQAMLDFELGLLRALATCGLAPPQAAAELSAHADADNFDPAALGRAAGEAGTPVPGLLAALRERLPETARAHLHAGATSQDVLDSALMLVAGRALPLVRRDLERSRRVCAHLADRHRRTLLPGRTLLQQATPLSFGLKAAGWLSSLHDADGQLARLLDDTLALQFGGAVGTLAALGDHGLEVTEALSRELGLPAPAVPWHTERSRPARLAATLGVALGQMGKVARDLVLLAQTEVGEAAEGGQGRGGSSTMPHKRNPVRAVAVLACAGQGPGLVAGVLAAMPQEHERAAGAWQAEWPALLALLRLTGSAADALAEALEGLEPAPDRMRSNLDITHGQVMSESVASALAGELGRGVAQDLVKRCAQAAARTGEGLAEVLARDEQVMRALGPDGLDRALDPAGYLGVSEALIDRVLRLEPPPPRS